MLSVPTTWRRNGGMVLTQFDMKTSLIYDNVCIFIGFSIM